MSPDTHADPIEGLQELLQEFQRREEYGEPAAAMESLSTLAHCFGHILGEPSLVAGNKTKMRSAAKPWTESQCDRLRILQQGFLGLMDSASALDSRIKEIRASKAEPSLKADETDKVASEVGAFFDGLAGWLLQCAEIPSSVEGAPDSLLARRFAVEIAAAADRLRFDELPSFQDNGPQDWFPLVTERPAPHTPLEISEWIRQQSLATRLGGGYKGRALVPFLGPGVIQAQADPPEAIEDTKSVFEDQAPLDQEFHAALVAQRRDRRELSAGDWSEIHGLADLRKALISAARLGTMIVSSCEDVLPIADWDRYEVHLEGASLQEFTNALAAAANAAAKLAERSDADRPDPDLRLLGAPAIAVRLQRLRQEVDPEKGQPRVMGSEVNWLTDCAWHSLVFRSATYPTMRELTLQVELCSAAGDAGPVRRLEPTEAIAHRTLNALTDHTTRAVLRGFRPSTGSGDSGRGGLYKAVARRLWQESTQGIAHPPLVVSMTFDLEMERGLLESRPAGMEYHVLVPALIPQSNERVSLRWMLGTYSADSSGGSDVLGSLRTPSWRSGEAAPQGPVVVKLNGSPLHRLPRIGPHRKPASPALLLRELDSLDIGVVGLVANALQRSSEPLDLSETPSKGGLAPSQAMPKWVLSRIASEVSSLLLVIGARWSDWSSRSQLFGLLSLPGVTPERQFPYRAFAVTESVDPDRAHLLDWLWVQLVIGDCLDLIPHIEGLVE